MLFLEVRWRFLQLIRLKFIVFFDVFQEKFVELFVRAVRTCIETLGFLSHYVWVDTLGKFEIHVARFILVFFPNLFSEHFLESALVLDKRLPSFSKFITEIKLDKERIKELNVLMTFDFLILSKELVLVLILILQICKFFNARHHILHHHFLILVESIESVETILFYRLLGPKFYNFNILKFIIFVVLNIESIVIDWILLKHIIMDKILYFTS